MGKWRDVFLAGLLFLLASSEVGAQNQRGVIDLGLSEEHFEKGGLPMGWTLRKGLSVPKAGSAKWVLKDGVPAVELSSNGTLTFLERTVDMDIKEFPIVAWSWRVENTLQGNDERTPEGDDHPIRLFFVFEPETASQSWWFRLKRFLYLDWIHGHPMGGRFTEYLWSNDLEPGSVIDDPGKPWQKLMVVEGGSKRVGRWLSYERNLYEDFIHLYGEEPRRLIFIGILNDTDQTGQSAVSYIKDLKFHIIPEQLQ